MRLILFRHGAAGRPDAGRWPDDIKRPLTRRGRERSLRAAQGLRRLVGNVRRVATSPLARARQTAEVIAEALAPGTRIETLEALAPGAPQREAVRWLRGVESGSSVILVGHEPHLGRLAGVLLFESAATHLPLKKSGAVLIDFVGPVAPGAGHLHAFLPPRTLRMLGRRKAAG